MKTCSHEYGRLFLTKIASPPLGRPSLRIGNCGNGPNVVRGKKRRFDRLSFLNEDHVVLRDIREEVCVLNSREETSSIPRDK